MVDGRVNHVASPLIDLHCARNRSTAIRFIGAGTDRLPDRWEKPPWSPFGIVHRDGINAQIHAMGR